MSVDRIELIASLKSYDIQPIEANDHLAIAVRKIMHKAVIQLLEGEIECHDEKNTKAFNRMRSATQRLSNLLRISIPYMYSQYAKKLNKRLKKLARQLENIHELTIMIRDLLHYGESMNHRMLVAGVVSQLDAQLLVAREQLLKYFTAKKYIEMIAILTDCLLNPIEKFFNLDENFRWQPVEVKHILPIILHEHLAGIRVFDSAIDKKIPINVYEEIRERVLQLKEITQNFENLLGVNATQYLDILADTHDKLNRLHDLNQMMNRLLHLSRVTLTPGQVAALKQYRRNLRTRREKIGAEFPSCWDNLHHKRNQKKFSETILELL